jgi:hypothetical protein
MDSRLPLQQSIQEINNFGAIGQGRVVGIPLS